MHFKIIGTIENVEVIAVGGNIRDIMRLRKQTVSVGGENSRALPMSGLKTAGEEKRKCTGTKRKASAGKN